MGCFLVVFLLVWGGFVGLVLVVGLFLRVFDTPVFWLVFNVFGLLFWGGFAFGWVLV